MKSYSHTVCSRKALPMVLDTADRSTKRIPHGLECVVEMLHESRLQGEHFTGTHDRFLKDRVDRESELAIGWSGQQCKEWDEFGKENNTFELTPEERRRYKDNGILL